MSDIKRNRQSPSLAPLCPRPLGLATCLPAHGHVLLSLFGPTALCTPAPRFSQLFLPFLFLRWECCPKFLNRLSPPGACCPKFLNDLEGLQNSLAIPFYLNRHVPYEAAGRPKRVEMFQIFQCLVKLGLGRNMQSFMQNLISQATPPPHPGQLSTPRCQLCFAEREELGRRSNRNCGCCWVNACLSVTP